MASWNKGKTTTPESPGNNPLMLWIRDAMSYQGDDCLIWPFARSRSGYGSFGRQGKAIYAHRYICIQVHGDPPTPKHHAAHSCGRGQEGCANPRHLSWKTNAENQLDRRSHGTHKKKGERWKLTPEKVVEIRSLKGVEPGATTAKRFGVTEATIRQIQSGKIWRTGRYEAGGFATKPYRGGRPKASPSCDVDQEYAIIGPRQ